MSLITRLRHLNHHHRRFFSSSSSSSSQSILSPDSTTPLTSKQKSRKALTLLKSETNPDRIVQICRAAALTPDSHLDRLAFSLAISKLSEDNHFSTIHNLLEDLKNTRNDLKTERFVSHSIVLYGQANMLEHAINAFKELHEGKQIVGTVKSLNSLLFACILAKDYKRLKSIFVDYPRIYGLKPDLDTYNKVIKAFTESGESASCFSVLAEMERNSLTPNSLTFSTVIAGFYKEEKFDDVGKVLNLMKEKYGVYPGLSTYNVRILSLCKLKRTAEAKALFDGMCSAGIKPNSVTFEYLITGFCKEGNCEEAKKLFKRMTNSGCKPLSSCYYTMVYFLCQGGCYEDALSICKESIEKGWVPNFGTMKSLVQGLAKISKVEEAKQIIGQMKEKYKAGADLWTEVEAALPQ
ncbi:hypothetical protein ACFE04_024976 [Oxalis oulophora]